MNVYPLWVYRVQPSAMRSIRWPAGVCGAVVLLLVSGYGFEFDLVDRCG